MKRDAYRLLPLIVFVMVCTVMVAFYGCGVKDETEENGTGAPEVYYEYGLDEECSNADGYFKISSINISDSFDEDSVTDGEYYVIVDFRTNLTNYTLSQSDNNAELCLSEGISLNLEFFLWDYEGCKLILKVPIVESVDYERLCKTEVSDGLSYPYLGIFLKCFDEYCVVDGEQYVGKCFVLHLSYI